MNKNLNEGQRREEGKRPTQSKSSINNNIVIKAINSYKHAIMEDRCKFCGGWGHSTPDCGTFKKVNRAFGRKG